MSEAGYVLDADVFITAKNAYYAFEICPGFWAAVLREHQKGRIRSISRVRGELTVSSKKEDLVRWVTSEVPEEFFVDVDDDEAVIAVYRQIMMWSQRHARYTDGAKAKFATGADGWLVAYAQVHGAIVVTNEQPAPDSKREIKLPDVCEQFNVASQDTFTMLRSLAVKLDLRAQGAT